ncbi:MAG: stress response translation initiation inhibitor YciH [Candidatus Micrarchaeota archaeon]
MSQICNVCGLPQEICACQTIEKETTQRLKVYTTAKKFRKLVTIIEGLTGEELEKTTKELKHKFACGGSCKEGFIILQGEHKEKVRKYLITVGYPAEIITVI